MAINWNGISGTNDATHSEFVTLSEAAGGEAYVIPLGSFILDAKYERDGQDLRLVDDYGREVVLDGYFSNAPYLPLTNELGATVEGQLVARFAGPGQIAQASETDTDKGNIVGTIETIEGSATVLHVDGTSETLQPGTEIYQNDVIETGSDAVLGVLMKDGSVLGVGSGSRMTIDNFVFDSSSNDGNLGLSFLKGAISFVSGKIAKNDYDDVDIKVPFGSIGIRGTEFVVDIGPDGTASVSVIEGAVFTTGNGQQVILDPGQLISIGPLGLTPVEQLAIAAIQARYEQILKAQDITIRLRDGREAQDDEGLKVVPESGESYPGNEQEHPGDSGGGQGSLDDGIIQVTEEIDQALSEAFPNLDITKISGQDIGLLAGPAPRGPGPDFRPVENDGLLGTDPIRTNFDFIGGAGDDQFVGGATDDEISGLGGNDTLFGSAGNDLVTGGAGDDNLSGDEGDDTVDGGTGNDYIEGGEGSVDILSGGAGNDVIYGDNADDADPTTGDLDTLMGQAGDDSLYGGGGDDDLYGGSGADLLVGGFGDDLLDGGDGQDIARFEGVSSEFIFQVSDSGFTIENVISGETDTLTNIEKISFDDDAFTLVTFDLFGDTSVEEGAAANYTISLGGPPLIEGQIATVKIALDKLDTSNTDYDDFLTVVQAAADGSTGITFNGEDTLSFAGGSGFDTELTISLPISPDLLTEPTEAFQVILSSPGGAGPEGSRVLGVLKNTDVTTEIEDLSALNIVWALEQKSASEVEGDAASYTISYSGVILGTDGDASIDVALITGSATGEDLEENLSERLLAAAAETTGMSVEGTRVIFSDAAPASFTFEIPLLFDGLAEGEESFSVVVSNPEINGSSGGEITSGGIVETTILDNEGDNIVFQVNGQNTVTEGASAAYSVGYSGTLAEGEIASVSLNLNLLGTQSGDLSSLEAALALAVASTSGVSLSGSTLTFDHTASNLEFSLDALNDGDVERPEAYEISLENDFSETGVSTGIDSAQETAQTTIISTDTTFVTFSVTTSDGSQAEGTTASYLISYSGAFPVGETVSVDVSLNDVSTSPADRESFLGALGNAVAGAPGVSISGNTLTFQSSVNSLSVDMDLSADVLIEGTESFTVSLSNATGSAIVLADIDPAAGDLTIDITDESSAAVSWSITENLDPISEGGSAQYIVSYGGATLEAGHTVSIDLSFLAGSGDSADFVESFSKDLTDAAALVSGVSISGTRIIFSDTAPTNIALSLPILMDGLAEPLETFTISISDPQVDGASAGAVNGSGAVTTSISDADVVVFSLSGDTNVAEGAAATYEISYSGALKSGEIASVQVNLSDGKTSGADYESFLTALGQAAGATAGVTLIENQLTFESTANSLNFSLNITDDTLVEDAEYFTITLSRDSAPNVATQIDPEANSVETTIIDGDVLLFTIAGDSFALEGQEAVYSIFVEGDLPIAETASIDVVLSDIETSPDDYSNFLSALSDAAAETEGVSVFGNTVTFESGATQFDFALALFTEDGVEEAENYTIGLENPNISSSAAVGVGAGANITTTIEDNDVLSLSFLQSSQSQAEGNAARFTIALAGLATLLGGPTSGFSALPLGAEVQFDLELGFVTADASDVSGMLIDALVPLPGGVIMTGSDNMVTVTITDSANFDNGQFDLVFDLALAGMDTTETDEEFTLTISNVNSVNVDVDTGTTVHTVTITDDGISSSPTEGADYLVGTNLADHIDALSGDDTVFGGNGDDTLIGNSGFDSLSGENGRDSLVGGGGNDTLLGGNGDDMLDGGSGVNRLEGGAGDDTYSLKFGDGSHTVFDSAGNDTLVIDELADVQRSGASDLTFRQHDGSSLIIDDLFGNSSLTKVELNHPAGNTSFDISKSLNGTEGRDIIVGNSGLNDALNGLGGDDFLIASSGNDTLNGDAGNDSLIGGAGSDQLSGGNDFDTALYSQATNAITVRLDSVSSVIGGADVGADTLESVERIVATDFADTIMVNAGFSGSHGDFAVVQGGDGNDVITGNGNTRIEYTDANGGVVVDLGAGTAQGADGEFGATNVGFDSIVSGVTQVVGSHFDDTLRGSANEAYEEYHALAGDDFIDGVKGFDRLTYKDATSGITAEFSGDNKGAGSVTDDAYGGIDVFQNIDEIEGTDFADLLTGSFWDDRFIGGDGNDTINGGGGQDTLDPGAGSDTVNGDGGFDTLTYASSEVGVSFAFSGSTSGTVTDETGTDSFTGFEVFQGSNFNDIFIGADGFVFDRFYGLDGDDLMMGNSGNDNLWGGDGNDTLMGGSDTDTLMGGAGADVMTGGDGTDIFAFNSLDDAVSVAFNMVFTGQSDVITDFTQGVDRLQLEDYDFSFNGGFDAFDDFLTTIGDGAYDGTNADYSGEQSGEEAKLIFDGSRLYYDDNESADGYTVIAEFSGSGPSSSDISVVSSSE